VLVIYCNRNPPVKITRPWSLASRCYSHHWLVVENRLWHYVNMAMLVTLCSLSCVANQKRATVLGAFHRRLLSKANGARHCWTCSNVAKLNVSCHVMPCHVISPNILSSERVDCARIQKVIRGKWMDVHWLPYPFL